MPAPKRIVRVNELLKREIADLIEFERAAFFDLIVSVTKVDTAPNLRQATVYISILGGSDEQKYSIIAYLKKKRPNIQKKMAKDVVLKYTPVLNFIYDKNIEEGDNIMALLDELNNE